MVPHQSRPNELASRKRRRIDLDISQDELGAMWDRIRLLEEENRALKTEIEALKAKFKMPHICPICQKSYNRTDSLFKHLWDGDEEHKRLATERYKTKCVECGKKCTRWSDLKKHMATHEQWSSRSADNLSVESDSSMCVVSSLIN